MKRLFSISFAVIGLGAFAIAQAAIGQETSPWCANCGIMQNMMMDEGGDDGGYECVEVEVGTGKGGCYVREYPCNCTTYPDGMTVCSSCSRCGFTGTSCGRTDLLSSRDLLPDGSLFVGGITDVIDPDRSEPVRDCNESIIARPTALVGE